MTRLLRLTGWAGPVKTITVVGVAAVVVVAAAISLTGTTSGRDVGNLEASVRAAIIADNTATMLPANVQAGKMADVDRQSLRSSLTSAYAAHFRQGALTRRLNGVLVWANRVAADPTEGRLLSFNLVDLSLDPLTIVSDSATVSGTYIIVEKQGFDLASGGMRTWGGTYKQQFTYQMTRDGGTWYVTDFTDTPLGFTPDPAMEAGADPSPVGTKPPPIVDPVPVLPNQAP